jgi:hypothetical protein
MSTAQRFEVNFNKFIVHPLSNVAGSSSQNHNNNNNNNKVYLSAGSKARCPVAKTAQAK